MATYEQMDSALGWASKYGNQIVIGGDFNTAIEHGTRWEKPAEWVQNNQLSITNRQEDDSLDEKWTWESSMGVRRQIDYFMISSAYRVRYGKATDDLRLFSDHRAVYTQPEFVVSQSHSTKTKKDRKFQLNKTRYFEEVENRIRETLPGNLLDIGGKL